MPKVLHIALAATAALLMAGGIALADEQPAPPEQTIGGATIGIGMICDTAEQAERYVELRAKGEDINPAAIKVNAETHNPRACGIAAIAYIADATVATRPKGASLLIVVRVNVVAGYNGSGWQRVTNMIQYAVIETKGIDI